MAKVFVFLALMAGSLSAAAPVRFELRDTKGAPHTAEEWRAKKAVVLFFTMTDCPLANGYVPEMNRMRAAYDPRGVAFYAVQVDNTVSDADVKKYAQEYGYTFPMLNDPRLTLARLTGAKVTPEVAVLVGQRRGFVPRARRQQGGGSHSSPVCRDRSGTSQRTRRSAGGKSSQRGEDESGRVLDQSGESDEVSMSWGIGGAGNCRRGGPDVQ